MGETNLFHCNSFKSKELMRSWTALDISKLTKIAYFCSLRGKIDFGNLFLFEKTA